MPLEHKPKEYRRSYFRVKDHLPVAYKKVSKDRIGSARIFTASWPTPPMLLDEPDPSVSPQVWRLLCSINAKMDLILERLDISEKRFKDSDMREVDISAAGLGFSISERLTPGDLIELSILLPLSPMVGVTVYGEVVRVEHIREGEWHTAVKFLDPEEDVLEAIVRYTLRRQQDIIRNNKLKDSIG